MNPDNVDALRVIGLAMMHLDFLFFCFLFSWKHHHHVFTDQRCEPVVSERDCSHTRIQLDDLDRCQFGRPDVTSLKDTGNISMHA